MVDIHVQDFCQQRRKQSCLSNSNKTLQICICDQKQTFLEDCGFHWLQALPFYVDCNSYMVKHVLGFMPLFAWSHNWTLYWIQVYDNPLKPETRLVLEFMMKAMPTFKILNAMAWYLSGITVGLAADEVGDLVSNLCWCRWVLL